MPPSQFGRLAFILFVVPGSAQIEEMLPALLARPHDGETLIDLTTSHPAKTKAQAEKALNVRTFFMMDENFLLYRKRALELLAEMKKHGKAWSMYVFSSANVLRKYDIPSGCNTQIGSQTMPQFRGILHEIARRGAEGWQIQLTVAMGNAVDDDHLLMQP